MHTPSPELVKQVRAELVARGTSLAAFCTANGFTRQAVTFALSGERQGERATSLLRAFMAALSASK